MKSRFGDKMLGPRVRYMFMCSAAVKGSTLDRRKVEEEVKLTTTATGHTKQSALLRSFVKRPDTKNCEELVCTARPRQHAARNTAARSQ